MTEVVPDPKPVPAVFDRAREVEAQQEQWMMRRAWQTFGCAVCGQVARPQAESGWQIEMHHTVNRSQGGHDSKQLGLCGELLPNKCHWRVTTNRLKLEETRAGWVWIDEKGNTGLCRVLSMEMAAETGLERDLTRSPAEVKVRVWDRRPIPLERAQQLAHEEGFPVERLLGKGVDGAEERFLVARELNHRAQRAWMGLALVIQKSLEMKDEIALGFETQEQWADAIGIPTTTFSKLKLIGTEFAGRWEQLPEMDKQNLSMEGLYLAARMVKVGHWNEEEALSEAVAQPVHRLYETYREVYDSKWAGREQHQCPLCGSFHRVHLGERPYKEPFGPRKELEPPVE